MTAVPEIESQTPARTIDECAGQHTYALFSALYAPHMGGVEVYTAGMAHELAYQGNRVMVVTSRLSEADQAFETQADGVEIYRLPCRALMDGRLPLPLHTAEHSAMLERIATAQPDRVVVNTRFYGHSLDGLAFAARLGVPALMIEHGSAHLSLGNPLANMAVEQFEHAITERVKAYGVPMYAVSEKARTWLAHFGIEGAGVIPNALDEQRWQQAHGASAADAVRDFRAECGVEADGVLVAVVGRLVPEKGIAAVLEAARILAKGDASLAPACADTHIVFAIAGDGPLAPQVEEACAQGLPVQALGRLATQDVDALLSCSDVYLLPSRSEGFATTLLEAAAAGAFPITTDVGGVAELGIGCEGGMVLPDASAASIVAALDVFCAQKDICAEQARALHSHAASCNTWTQSVQALEQAFSSIEEAAAQAPSETAAAAAGALGAFGARARKAPGARNVDAAAEQAEAAGDTGEFEGDELLDKLHSVLLMMIGDFAEICEREGISWIAMYGTAIGALRHGGFIPWDDDIDVCMLRPDLERFEQAVLNDPTHKYSIVNAQLYPTYPLATTRFVLNGTEFRDSALATMDFPSGIFIDVFPLDNLSDNELIYQGQVWGSWFMNKLAIAKLAENPTIARSGMLGRTMALAAQAGHAVLNLPGLRDLDPNVVAYALLTCSKDTDTRRVGFTCETFPLGDLYTRDELFPVRWVPFEDREVPIAHQAEKLLTDFYGDWMTPPPGNARRAHYPDVLDFGPYA